MKSLRYLLLLLVTVGTAAACQPVVSTDVTPLPAERLLGTIVQVGDGDSLILRSSEGRRHRIRLAEIDAPELDQPWGIEARDTLRQWALQQPAVAHIWERDQYQRLVATVLVDGIDLNARLLQEGHAWLYRRHQRRPELSLLEAAARDQSLGLWQLPAAQRRPPWAWRHQQRQSSPGPTPATTTAN